MSEVQRYRLVDADTGEPVFGNKVFHAGQVLTCPVPFTSEMLEWMLSILREHGALVVLDADLTGYSLVDELLKALQTKGKP